MIGISGTGHEYIPENETGTVEPDHAFCASIGGRRDSDY
jgi:hypothetical protein